MKKTQLMKPCMKMKVFQLLNQPKLKIIKRKTRINKTNGRKTTTVEEVAITAENREEVIVKYSPMIKYVANRIAMRLPPHVEVDDLISVGSIWV